MKTLTLNDIRAQGPCTNPLRYVKKNWRGTVLDILELKRVSAVGRIWLVSKLVSERTNRLFAVYCARRLMAPYHPVSTAGDALIINTLEQYIFNNNYVGLLRFWDNDKFFGFT